MTMDQKLMAALQALTDRVIDWTGVTGTAIGELNGMPCLTVYLSDPTIKGRLPKALDGFPVVVEIAGPFKAL
jgi:hypothetical protein